MRLSFIDFDLFYKCDPLRQVWLYPDPKFKYFYFIFGILTPLSELFQLYHGDQF